MGGGRQCLQSGITRDIDTGACARKDGRDLIQTWKEDKTARNKTWRFVENREQLLNLDADYVMGIFSNAHMPYQDERSTQPSLEDMTRAAIKILTKNQEGFVLIVEGGLIDQAHHRGYVRRAMVETLEFQDAIDAAVNITSAEDTLIIATADHAHSMTINGATSDRGNIMGFTKPSRVDKLPFNILGYMIGTPNTFPYSVQDGAVVRRDPRLQDPTKPDFWPMAHLFHHVHEQSYVAYVMAYAAGIGDFKGRTNSATTIHISYFVFLPLPTLYLFFRRNAL